MSDWLRRVSSEPDDLNLAMDALDYYETRLQEGLSELDPKGRVWDKAKMIPGLQAYWYGMWKEINALTQFLGIRAVKANHEAQIAYITTFKGRELSENQARRLAEGDPTVLAVRELAVHFQLLTEKFEGLTKGLESMHFQIGNLTKLREAGIEDAIF
jgi:hypothetical protein